MDVEFRKKGRSKPRFIFEDDNDFIKREPVKNEELEITPVIDLDAVKTGQDEPNQSEKNDLNCQIETQLNFPIENQANVLKTYARNKAKITKHYTRSTSRNSDNLTVPELIVNRPNETQSVETIEPVAEVEVKENITFEELENIVIKIEENVVKQPLAIEDDTHNLINDKSALKDTVQNVVNSSMPLVIEDTNKISCMYCEVKVKDLIQLAIHIHNLHYKLPCLLKNRPIGPYFKMCDHCGYQTKRKTTLIKHIFAKHMPKTAQMPGRKDFKYTCSFCNEKFTTKCKMSKHIRTHNGKRQRPSCRCVHRSLGIHVKAPGGRAPFTCNLCKLVTCTTGYLNFHMVRFHNMRSVVYECHHCQLSFSHKDHLIAHLKLQSDDYTSPYKCSNINYKYAKGFKYDYDTCLKKGEKKFIENYEILSQPYECGTCPFKCTNRLHLKAHFNKYNAVMAKKPVPVEKVYLCQFCKFKSTKERDLNQHLKKNHKEIRPFFCKLCDCKYSMLNQLVKHIKSIHFGRKK